MLHMQMRQSQPDLIRTILPIVMAHIHIYSELLQKISDLKQQAPFLTDLLESSGEIRLTAEEHAAFTQYLLLVCQRDDMERQQIYFRGHTEAVSYLKKIKAI